MDTTKIREAIAAIESAMSRLSLDKYALVLQLEESEGRPQSHDARFARAALAKDVKAMDRLCAEGEVAYRDRFGHPTQPEIRAEVERILAEREAEADAAMFADRPSHRTEIPGPVASGDPLAG